METRPHIRSICTRQEIADNIGISVSTLYRKLKKADLKISSGYLNPKEQMLIYTLFGIPVTSTPFNDSKNYFYMKST